MPQRPLKGHVFDLLTFEKNFFGKILKPQEKCARNFKLFFENLPARASSLQINM